MGWAFGAKKENKSGIYAYDAILARGDLHDYALAHSARADLCRRLGMLADARASYERALGPSGGSSNSG